MQTIFKMSSDKGETGGFRAQADRMGRALCCAAEVPISFRDTKVRHSLHTKLIHSRHLILQI